MANTTDDRKLYTVMLTGPQLNLLTQAIAALEFRTIEAERAGAHDLEWIKELIGPTHLTLTDVLEEWYRDNGVTD